MSREYLKSRGRVSIFDLMLLLFIGLKLTHNIDWSWWWVTAPAWSEIILLVIFSKRMEK